MSHVFKTQEQKLAVDGLRRFLDAEIEPVVKEYRDQFIPKEKMQEIMRQLVQYGLVGGVISEKNGGLGGNGDDWLTGMMLFEELAYTSIDLSTVTLINTFGAVLLESVAPAHLRDRYLPGLLSGETFISMGISEPDVGSNVMEIKTRARRDGDDYIINGEKTWISNGMYSDFLICTCRTSDDPKKGLTHFLLDRKEHPYEVRNIHKIAMNSQSTSQIFLSDVRVPASNIIGGEGDGLKNTLRLFERSRVYVAGQGLGIARRSLEESVRYAQERRQHGKVIAGHQLIASMLADMATKVDASRLLIHRAAQMIDAGVPAEMEAAMAKYYAAEAAVEICRQGVQIHGANGVTTEFLVEKLAREAIIVPIPEGTSQIQQLIIARALTGVGAF
ncbi:acyl-CoA dehydrogenase family protein [Acinetobacter sp. AS23]|uniref:acyl-CoA dehydrogenase family protein n=1 Tax=Acinetobacter sp. AS23 TaxID=2871688 RepID=UPI0020273D25|nr:acyl-CoA dehydrogenase family protein [Acinetobacter sp. AS23]URM41969.1 acyl-CoA/acyl-ACP dehydrogenase [Acinetobacter sp. AS23]